MARVVAMLGDVCPSCMRVHAPPACNHDCTKPCPGCGEPIGMLAAEMDGSRCWFCVSGRTRGTGPTRAHDVEIPAEPMMTGLLIRDGDGVTARLTSQSGYVYRLTGVKSEGGYQVAVSVIHVPEWVALPGDPVEVVT